jgi:hypothetical protein
MKLCSNELGKKEISFFSKKDKFDCPVFIETKNMIAHLNRFPDKMEY